MKKKNLTFSSHLFTLSILLTTHMAQAFVIENIPGEIKSFNSPQGKKEICVISTKLFSDKYSKKDLKEEQELCAIDFYTTHGLCPKENSTNPGVLITEIEEGQTREQTQQACIQHKDYSKVAKFKNSISCSYTPSLLAYYHFSKILEMGRVPPVVLRTMETETHQDLITQAKRFLAKQTGELIYKTWSMFDNEHKTKSNANLFDSTQQFVWGALTDNPKKESKYTELNRSKGYETRYTDFAANPLFLRTTQELPIQKLIDASKPKEAIQSVVQMKDIAEMVILDTLFNQQDRIGNIHFKFVWYKLVQNPETKEYSVEQKKSKAEVAANKVSVIIPENEKHYESEGYFLIKELLLKDNDCGVAKQNMMKDLNLVTKLRHMSRSSYQSLLAFNEKATTPEVIDWMKSTLQMTEQDIGIKANPKGFLNNLKYVVTSLQANCKSGALKLDVDLKDVLAQRISTIEDCELVK